MVREVGRFGGTLSVAAPLVLRAVARIAALALVIGLGVPSTASAEIYGWVDASGSVTYSNLPPPRGAKLTDVIHEEPMSPQEVADANHRSEVSALNDRIRLLELEMARSQREVVDYPAPAPSPAGLGCGADGMFDCSAPWGYATGILYGTGRGFRVLNVRHPIGGGRPSGRLPGGPARAGSVAAVRGSAGRVGR